ncbi:sulfatase-like hydrolase/transferase [Halomonas sp. ML-15]|uniref:sulfatase-like hydrolase/transferase n=1 Tax=Halomonas sp. ML-15 TaxID=2773305 RepID=UPI001745D82F|nr:sulfatase-like hydrolase/transferase [Halomonas sp. ML-15]MBD3898281.1 sulfatase-like hydrolase/transferase [Halomonas sp. ML-15]
MRWLISGLLLNILVLIPLWWRFTEITPRLVAWEAWWLAALFALLPLAAWSLALRWVAVLVVLLGVLAGLGEAAAQMALGRSLNVYLDLPLLRAIYHLLQGNLGDLAAVVAMILGVLLIVAVAWGLLRMLAALLARPQRGVARGITLVALAVTTLLGALEIAGTRLVSAARTPLVDTWRYQAEQVVVTHQARQAFSERLAESPSPARPLPGLEGRDVILAFVESYGVAAVEDDRYSHVLLPTLAEMEERLAAAGLDVVSGVLDAPIRGGQSWLAHATTLSGLWIDNQLWYRLLLDSDQATLIDDFRATGQRTQTVMPAITMLWPEGEAYGFDDIYAAADIDYAGPPLHWVTMPDQFVLDYYQRQIREPQQTPLFTQIALISSHAPWTPILPVLEEWELIGDGSLFAPWEHAGDPPEVVWQDIERIRDHYAWSVDYSVKATARWAEWAVDDNTLLIMLGDHQAAPLITGEGASLGVPVHIISGDPALLAPFLERGFVPGTQPPPSQGAAGMDRLRGWLHEDFGEPGAEFEPLDDAQRLPDASP